MIDLRAVHRYTKAIFQLAEKKNQLDQVDDQLIEVRKLVESHREISHLVSNSTIAQEEKEDFISKIVPSTTHPLVVDFLKVLIEKKRFFELASIQREFHKLYERKKRIEEVVVISAVPLSKQNLEKLAKVLTQKFKFNVSIISKIDPKMIGGLILRFGGHEMNASLRSRLDNLHQALMA